MKGIKDLARVQAAKGSQPEVQKFVKELRQRCYDAMNDDLQTPLVISALFEACHLVNQLVDHKAKISADDLKELVDTMRLFTFDLLGLKDDAAEGQRLLEKRLMARSWRWCCDLRQQAKEAKDWATSDQIRDALNDAGFVINDTKDGTTWSL